MEKLKVDDFTDYSFLSQVKFSPDGRHIALRVTKADKEENEYNSCLWLYDLEEQKLSQLTAGKKDQNFIWIDSENIVFISQRESEEEQSLKPKTELYQINITGGEAVKLKDIELGVEKFKFDGQHSIIFTAKKDLRERDEEKLKEEEEYEVLEEIPYWQNGSGFTDGYRTHLFRLDLSTGDVEELIEDKYNIEDFDVQGNHICLNMNYFEDKAPVSSNLYYFNQKSRSLTLLCDKNWRIDSVNFKDNNNIYVTAGEMEKIGLNTNPDIFLYDIEKGELVQLTDDFDQSLWSSVGNDSRYGTGKTKAVENDRFYFVSTDGYNSHLYYLQDNNVIQLIEEPGSVDMFDVYEDKVVYVAFRENKLQELYLLTPEGERQLSKFNENILADKMLSTPEYFAVKASDGTDIDAWIMKPVNFKEGKKYPAVLEIHGGPKSVYGTIFFHEFQVLASAGYAVIFSNPRGSDGRGNDFADIRGNYGTRDYMDIMEVMDTALERFDFIDESSLGVAGGSYGGYMTNWIIGHTDRFQAAVSQRSIANWISMFATTDIGYFFVEDQFKGATPWSDMEKLWDGSPLKYADNVNTPTLFIHSEQDYRCWLTEGLQMFTALKYHGVESRLCLFKGENHELSRGGRPEQRIRRLNEMLCWFNKYLK